MERAELNSLMELAIKAAQSASSVLLEHLDKQNEALVIRAKRDGSLVSSADMASHRIIQNVLADSGIPLISEEGDLPAFSERSTWPLYWLVDPLDGTESFLKNRSGFAINIALCDQDGPFLGVVADPLEDRMYVGAQSIGAYVSGIQRLNRQKIVPLAVSKPYLLVTSWNEPLPWESLLPAHLNPKDFNSQPVSGALKFCQVATGEADVHARSGPYMEWDCAAGDGIVRSMGLMVRDNTTHQPLRYNTMSLRVEGLWVSRI